MRILLTITIVMLSASAAVEAGMVQTHDARLEGKVVFHKDHLTVDGEKVEWDDVLYLLPDSDVKPAVRPQRVQLKNGESWAAEFLDLTPKDLEIRSDLFGKKRINLDLVAGLEFAAFSGRHDLRKAGVLYRAKGEPIPGKLIAVTPDKIKVDSAVGELDLRREGLISYRFETEMLARTPGDDEVTLIDGSRFRGKFRPGPDKWELEHATLGKLTFPPALVHSLVRNSDRVFSLSEVPPSAVRAMPLLTSKDSDVPTVQVVDALSDSPGAFIKGLRFEPNLSAEYKLPRRGNKEGQLRAVLMPVANAGGDVKIQIKVAGIVVLERDVTPKSKSEAISLDVATGVTVEIAVSFGAAVRFPSGIILGDPHVIWEAP